MTSNEKFNKLVLLSGPLFLDKTYDMFVLENVERSVTYQKPS